jgi:hypothetical protein
MRDDTDTVYLVATAVDHIITMSTHLRRVGRVGTVLPEDQDMKHCWPWIFSGG